MDVSIARVHQAGDCEHEDDAAFDDGEPQHEGGGDFDPTVNEHGDEQRADHVDQIPGTSDVGFDARGGLDQEAQVSQVNRSGQRLVQEEHPAGEKAGLGI